MKEATKNKLIDFGVILKPVDRVAKPIVNMFGIENIKEVAAVICGVVNAVVNKKGLGTYVGMLPDVLAAVEGIELIDDEVFDMTDAEFAELAEFIKSKLDFEGDANAVESLVEDLTVHVLGIVLSILKLTNLKKSA